jgi:hypothetical protein
MKIEFLGSWYSVVSINFYGDQVAIIYKRDGGEKLVYMHVSEFKQIGKEI